MRTIFQNLKKNTIKLEVTSLDDLWYLSYIIEKSDVIKARTLRKIKIGKEHERATKILKKPVFLTIKVEKAEFHKYNNVLRVSGTIISGPEDIPLGSYHTINLEENTIFELQKEKFLNYQIEKIKEATQGTRSNILICVHDREEAYFALLKRYGYELLTHIKGDVTKKADANTKSEDFYSHVKKIIQEYDKKYNFTNIVIASPSFWREYLMKKITEKSLQERIVVATCSCVGETGINELMKRPEVKTVLKMERFSKEISLVEKLLEEIAKDNLAVYGFNEVRVAIEAGAVSDLLISDAFIHGKRQEAQFEEVDELMKKTEKINARVHIITSEHEGGKKLDGLGGIAALLRYKLNY
ncbi:mRNA surveillance protein pelota [Candidatus Woesearchaeota archaeon]|nr:mRNA surveillance protein pelota [Candidatus Woesearchaeota archaeon]